MVVHSHFDCHLHLLEMKKLGLVPYGFVLLPAMSWSGSVRFCIVTGNVLVWFRTVLYRYRQCLGLVPYDFVLLPAMSWIGT